MGGHLALENIKKNSKVPSIGELITSEIGNYDVAYNWWIGLRQEYLGDWFLNDGEPASTYISFDTSLDFLLKSDLKCVENPKNICARLFRT